MPQLNQASGVDYDALDAFKRMAQKAARSTSKYIERFNMDTLEATRGESAFLFDTGDCYLAFVEEGLGTKCLVADAMNKLVPLNEYYGGIGQDGAAMILNDVSALGAMPVVLAMHLAVGDSKWFENSIRAGKLVEGWKHACDYAGCVWGPGETPELRELVNPESVVLSGSAIGTTLGHRWFNPNDIEPGDAIVFLESTGPHANGFTKAREVAAKLPNGYLTEVPGYGGKCYGEALLNPTHIYASAVELCLRQDIDVHYAVNITGHGWRKLMRAVQPFTYVILELPRQFPVFDFIQEHAHLTNKEMYGSYNMGAGFALYMPLHSARHFVKAVRGSAFRAYIAGYIEEGEKRVVIEPKDIEFRGDSMNIR